MAKGKTTKKTTKKAPAKKTNKKAPAKKTTKKTPPKKTTKNTKKTPPKKNAKGKAKQVRRKYKGCVCIISGGDVLKASRCVLATVDVTKNDDVRQIMGDKYVPIYGKEIFCSTVKHETPAEIFDSFVKKHSDKLVDGTDSCYAISIQHVKDEIKSLAEVTTAQRLKFDTYVKTAEEEVSDDGEESDDGEVSDAGDSDAGESDDGEVSDDGSSDGEESDDGGYDEESED
jgi:hypothetical protein